MNNKTTNGANQPKKVQENKEWVFIPLSKELILKSTETYILFKLGDGATAIVSAKFKRNKEHDDCIFLSVPSTYNFSCQIREYDAEQGRYVPVRKWDMKPEEIKNILSGDELPF